MNARQKRLFEEARKRNPDLKIPSDTQTPTEWTEADLALIKQGVGDKSSRSQNSGDSADSSGEAPAGEQSGSVVTYFEAKGFGFSGLTTAAEIFSFTSHDWPRGWRRIFGPAPASSTSWGWTGQGRWRPAASASRLHPPSRFIVIISTLAKHRPTAIGAGEDHSHV